MNDKRLQRALRGGPPFATQYIERAIPLDRGPSAAVGGLRPLALLLLAIALILVALTTGLVTGALQSTLRPDPQTEPIPVVDLSANIAHVMAPSDAGAVALAEVGRQNAETAAHIGPGEQTVTAKVLAIRLLRPGEHYQAENGEVWYDGTAWAVRWSGTLWNCLGTLCHSYQGGTFIVDDATGDVVRMDFVRNE